MQHSIHMIIDTEYYLCIYLLPSGAWKASLNLTIMMFCVAEVRVVAFLIEDVIARFYCMLLGDSHVGYNVGAALVQFVGNIDSSVL